MSSITKTEDTIEHGLFHRRIRGLNIFTANGLAVPALADPRLVFLKALSEQVPCSAHIGSLAMTDLVDAPEELFGLSREELHYSRTRISFHDGFYDLNEYPCWDACFFPRVTPAFWDARLPEEERQDASDWQGLDYLIVAHGLVFYVGASPMALAAINVLLEKPFPGHEQWLQQTSHLFVSLVMVGHDGDYLHAITRDAATLSALAAPLARAEEVILASTWFQEHKGAFEWDSEYSLCLIAQG